MADSKSAYATEFTSINKLLSTIIGEFPYTIYDPKDKGLRIVEYLSLISRDFCVSLAERKIILGQDASKQGSFGIVGPIYAKIESGTVMLYANNISFPNYDGSRGKCTKETCKWSLHEIDLLIKASKEPQDIYLRVESSRVQKGIKLYRANDSLNEAIIGGLASYLYDLGIAPCVPKHFGYYACPINSNTGRPLFNTSIVMEKSSMPMIDILGRSNQGTAYLGLRSKRSNKLGTTIFDKLSIVDLVIWSCHVARTLFVLKYHFGIVHFDCHLKNILLTLVTDRFGGQPIDLVYGGMHLNKVRYFNYSLPNGKHLILENNGLMPKIIDYGLTIADFTSSVENKSIKAKILNGDEIESTPGWQKGVEDRNGYGDADFNFFVYCMVTQLYKISHGIGYFGLTDVQQTKAANLYRLYVEFATMVVPKFSLSQTIDSSGRNIQFVANVQKLMDDPNMWTFHSRNVGTTSDISSPLNRIYAYLSAKGLALPNGNVFVTSDNNHPSTEEITLNVGYKTQCKGVTKNYQGCPKESAHIQLIKTILKHCPIDSSSLSPEQKVKCKRLKINANAMNANNTLFKRLIPKDVVTDPSVWSNNTLNAPILFEDIQSFIEYKSPNNNYAIARMFLPLNGVNREIVLLYIASKGMVPHIDVVNSSASAYEITSEISKAGVSIIGGLPYNKPVGVFYNNGVDIGDKTFVKQKDIMVLSKAPGEAISLARYNEVEDYSKARFAFNAPLAIANDIVNPTDSNSGDQPSRSILGITHKGETLCIIALGGNVYNPGLTPDQLSFIALHFNMRSAVHYGYGFENNIIVKDSDKSMWALTPDMYSNTYGSQALLMSFVEN